MLGEFKSSLGAFLMLAVWPRHVDLSPPAADALGEEGSDAVQSGDRGDRCVWVEHVGGGGRIVHERGVGHGHILREGGHASVRACAWRSASHLMLEWGPRPVRAVCSLNTRNGQGAAKGPNRTPRSPGGRVNHADRRI